MKWGAAPLEVVAPAQASDLRFGPDEIVWHLTLDQIEAHTGRILEKTQKPFAEAGVSTFVFDHRNVLYSKLRPYLNKVVCPTEPGVATTELVPLRPDPRILDRNFLAYYLRSQRFLAFASSTVAGVKMPRVIMSKLWEHEVPLPPLSEQRRIVEILDQADALRKKRAEADARAARILPALFYKMFGDPATNPKGWPMKPLGEAWQISGGGTPSRTVQDFWGGSIPWVSPKDMKTEVILDTEEHITAEAVSNSASRLVPPGSLLIVFRSGILVHTFPAAITAVEVAINQDLKALQPVGNDRNEYLFGLFAAAPTIPLSCVKKGATVHNVDGARFSSLPIPLPPTSLQRQFAQHLKTVLAMKTKEREVGRRIEDVFSTLLHRAFTGDLTARWRLAHMKELLAEMKAQTKALEAVR